MSLQSSSRRLMRQVFRHLLIDLTFTVVLIKAACGKRVPDADPELLVKSPSLFLLVSDWHKLFELFTMISIQAFAES